MFLYQTHPDHLNAVLVIQLDLGDYQMTYHHMYQNEGRELISFSQNRRPGNNDIAYIREWIAPLYEDFHVMNLFRESFENCLLQESLHVFTH